MLEVSGVGICICMACICNFLPSVCWESRTRWRVVFSLFFSVSAFAHIYKDGGGGYRWDIQKVFGIWGLLRLAGPGVFDRCTRNGHDRLLFIRNRDITNRR